jgi:hypothetical protein
VVSATPEEAFFIYLSIPKITSNDAGLRDFRAGKISLKYQVILTRTSTPFSLTPAAYHRVENVLSAPRLGRYVSEAKGDKALAFRLYRWNVQLCESLYVSTQFVEVGVRNCISHALEKRFGALWPLMSDSRRMSAMPQGGRELLATERTRILRGHKVEYISADKVIASMTFGFWSRMLGGHYDRVLWGGGLRTYFPHIPQTIKIRDLENRIRSINDFRNKIAHHEPIFHHRPNRHYQEILETLEWICPETKLVVQDLSDFPLILAARPH